MLTQEHINNLLSCEWLPKRFGNTAYLAKFKAYPEDNICTFILTDTKHVWGEGELSFSVIITLFAQQTVHIVLSVEHRAILFTDRTCYHSG
ncbi:hypothetical protein CPB86DRAFT_779832, partial [Serendipita vermifera]